MLHLMTPFWMQMKRKFSAAYRGAQQIKAASATPLGYRCVRVVVVAPAGSALNAKTGCVEAPYCTWCFACPCARLISERKEAIEELYG